MSVIYELDPRAKLLCVLLFTVMVFLIDRFLAVVCLMLFLAVFRLAVRVPFRVIKHIKNLSLLAAFIVLVQTLLSPGNNYIIKPLFPPSFPVFGGMGSLKWEGLVLGIIIVCRLFSLMILFSVFTETTSPYRFAAGLYTLGFNYRTSFIITTAFNLIPLFTEEACVIMDAQKLRGMRSFEKGHFFAKLKAYPGIVLPLVLGAMRKAQMSSLVMDSRAFGVYKTRTWLDKPEMKTHDFFFIVICVVFFLLMLFLNYSKCLEYPWPGK
ncbi:MAG: energy-coupling factor transporter transmembrane protein EcfT [Treponema sp.]|jgi:energy-coupling factor transport system permease protein|nr:energy-coupling factor transporter transmembrane protein EcfT [Treponema sp.]